MELNQHSMPDLFEQLGLSSRAADIEEFVERHSHQLGARALHEAKFWTPAQAEFLREAIEDDADWAEVVDQLDAMLR